MGRVFEVHVEQTLVSAVKRDSALCHGKQGVVVSQVWCQHHDASVEDVRPSDIRCSTKSVWKSEELIRRPVGDNIGVEVHDFCKLRLLPEVYFCKRRVKVGAVHQVEIGAVLVADSGDWNDMVVDALEPRYGVGRDAIEGEEDGKFSRGACVAKGMCKDERA